MSQKTLTSTIFKSFFPLFFSCVLILITALLALIYLQRHTNNIVYKRIPVTEAASELVISIDNCILELKNWIMTEGKQMLSCHSKFDSNLEVLEKTIGAQAQAKINVTKKLLKNLEDSISYIEDLTKIPTPKLKELVYEKDLLPIYSKIQNILNTIPPQERENREIHKVEMEATLIDNALRQAIKDVHNENNDLDLLKNLERKYYSEKKKTDALETEPKINLKNTVYYKALTHEHKKYKKLSEIILDTKKATVWRHARHIIKIDIHPLAGDIRRGLDTLKIQNSQLLESTTNHSIKLTWIIIGFLLMAITVMGILTILSVKSIANSFQEKIDALSQAASLIGKKSFEPLVLHQDSPVELKFLADNINQSAEKIKNQTKELQQVINALKIYSQIISHDLKTPIINVIGYINVLNELVSAIAKKNNEVVSEDNIDGLVSSLDHLEKSFTKIQVFISSIINNSRIFSHNTIKQETNIQSLVCDVLAFFPSDSHKLDLNIPNDLTVETDAFLLEHILMNLVDNAIKYARDNAPLKIAIQASVNESEIILSVKDNGIGVNSAVDIAEPFFQEMNKAEGFGLGLALAVSMAEQLEGRINWDNNINDFGTEFKVYLPIK